MQAEQMNSKVSARTIELLENVPKRQMYLEEAEFGLTRILPILSQKSTGSRVLEIGSGPCVVLNELASRFPEHQFQGIEPMSDGFAHFDSFICEIKRMHPSLNVHLGGYESFNDGNKWDLIFLVNVFEHLPDWRHFLDFVGDRLAPSGQCVALFPNYGFPYESHFRLPIIGNKAMTQRVFAQKIKRFENENDLAGLFYSLNFVKLRHVRKEAKDRGLQLEVRADIILEMIKRLETDPEFATRQGRLAWPARILGRSGLLERAFSSTWVQNILPYVEIRLCK